MRIQKSDEFLRMLGVTFLRGLENFVKRARREYI